MNPADKVDFHEKVVLITSAATLTGDPALDALLRAAVPMRRPARHVSLPFPGLRWS